MNDSIKSEPQGAIKMLWTGDKKWTMNSQDR